MNLNRDTKIIDYVYDTEDGRTLVMPFTQKFHGGFGCDEPGGEPFYENGKEVFNIPAWETVENFKRVVEKSLQIGKDLISERYKEHKFPPYDGHSLY
jgi:hypothetical protein